MKTKNLGLPYDHRVTLRLNDDQYNFVIRVSDLLGVAPSDYIRMAINSGMVSMGSQLDKMMKGQVGTSNENVKTDLNDQL